MRAASVGLRLADVTEMPMLRERRHLSDDARAARTRGGQRWECAECAASTSSSRPPDKGRPASRASSTALSGMPVGSRGFRGRLRLALLPGGRRGQPCSLRKQRQSRRRRPTHRLLVVLGNLVRTTAGKWITRPPTRCPNGHRLGPNQVLVVHVVCLGHGGGGHKRNPGVPNLVI